MPIQQSDNIKIETRNQIISCLNIKTASVENAGTYKIKAANSVGFLEHSFDLVVEGIFLKHIIFKL